jgi:hypothetical protein
MKGQDMNARTEQALLKKLRALAPQRLAEVEDFVDFLRARDEEPGLARAITDSAEPAFAKVWDNDEDAAYDKL